MSKFKVCIDAGHGGADPGSIARPSGVQEADINMSVANMLFGTLGRTGNIQPVLTRKGLEGVPFVKRVQIGDDCHALVSLHCNAAQSPGGNGVEVWAFDEDEDGKELARFILDELLALRFVINGRPYQLRDRGVKTGGFYMIRKPKVPRCLVEMGFLSNDCDRLVLTENKGALVDAIAKGIEAFFADRGEAG